MSVSLDDVRLYLETCSLPQLNEVLDVLRQELNGRGLHLESAGLVLTQGILERSYYGKNLPRETEVPRASV